MYQDDFTRGLKPAELAYYESLRLLPLPELEKRFAALRTINDRFLGKMRTTTYVYVNRCMTICQYVLIEYAARTGFTLTTDEIQALEHEAKNDVTIAGRTLAEISNSIEPDPELDAAIAYYYAIHPLGQKHY